MNPVRIIISDDNTTHRFLIRESIEEQLEFFNSKFYIELEEKDKDEYIIEFSDGDETLVYLKENSNIDYLFLDINMPKDGLEVLEELRLDPKNDKLKIIMLTSSDMESEIQTSLDLKADAFLIKPYNVAGWQSKFDIFNRVFIKGEDIDEKTIKKHFLFINKI